MKVLFAHDNRFIPLEGEIYSESQFPSSMWHRYLLHFDSLVVFARQGSLPSNKTKGDLTKSSAAKVSFVFGPNLSSPKAQIFRKKEAVNILRDSLRNIDAVIARLPSELGLLAIEEAERKHIPWAVEVVGCPWDGLWNYGNLLGKFYAPVMMARTRVTVKKAPFAIYVTRFFLQNRYPNRGSYNVACSDVEISNPSEIVLEKRLDKIKTDPTPFVIGLIGTLRTKYKGINTVFESLARARHDLPHILFRILGPGDPRPWHEEAAKLGVGDLVAFDGVLPTGDPVLKWLDNVDLYLQPSFQEGLPRALVEAMSRGCPAIGSNCGGIPELIETKCMIRPGDANHLAKLLTEAVTNKEWQKNQAVLNWHKAREYNKERLETVRNDFWSRFALYVREQHQKNYARGLSPF